MVSRMALYTFSGKRARITSSEKTLTPKSWRTDIPFLGARRPELGHDVTALIADCLTRGYSIEWLLDVEGVCYRESGNVDRSGKPFRATETPRVPSSRRGVEVLAGKFQGSQTTKSKLASRTVMAEQQA